MKVITTNMVILDDDEHFEIDVTTSGLYPARVKAYRLEHVPGSDRVSVDGLKIKADGSVGQTYLNAHIRDDFTQIPTEVQRALGIDTPQEHR